MWNLPGPGIERASPALTGEFFTTEPPGKSLSLSFYFGTRERRLSLGNSSHTQFQVSCGCPPPHSIPASGSNLIPDNVQHLLLAFPSCLPSCQPTFPEPPPLPWLSCSFLLHWAQRCPELQHIFSTGNEEIEIFVFAQKLPFSTVAKIPPQNRKNSHSHTKRQYLLSWHHGQKLARERRGRPQRSLL